VTQLKEISGVLTQQVFLESVGAAGTTGNLPAFRAPGKIEVVSAALVPAAAITANGTNFSVYTLTRHTAGAGAATVATRTWAATDSAALTPEEMALSGTAANLVLAAGDTLSIVKTVGGTGLVIPATLLVLSYRYAGV
jgi:hypothetical protein